MSGKWHMGLADKAQKGFHYWYSHQKGGGPYYKAPMYKDEKLIYEEEYITDKMTDYAIEFLNKEKEPFFLNVNYTAPPSPWDRKNHKEEILKLYDNCKFESCPRDPYHSWKIAETFEGNEEERIEILKGYFAALTAMDMGIGKIINELEKKDILKNILIIFTSDNGMNMGHHGIFGKGNGTSPLNMYDSSIKVPFIIYKKDETEAEIVTNLLSHYDIRSTLLEYLGLDDIEDEHVDYPGKSFSEILNNKIDNDKNVVIYDEYGPTRMIRNEKYKYVHRYPDGPHEFYDLEKDKNENINEINNENYREIIDEMRKELEIWFLNYVNKEIDGATLPIYGAGQKRFAGKWGGYARDTFGRYHSKFIFSSDAKLDEKTETKIENKIQ